ncbi:formylglycine-generating enzyme family protein [uncultured Draconibacterium sp.]|uniref:formylglycine-generating enzyme family protein n=1 Tax=uncultured Draconibacterium sp. TaxID=1573823 RepID=UPI0025D02682|nr:formylglycine-generating enzyme family protein [uncultured Draconibacterium sp.]
MKKTIIVSLAVALAACSGNKTNEKPGTLKQAPEKIQEQSAEPVSPTVEESEMIAFEGGRFLMGSANGLPQESPAHEVVVKAFKIDKSPVTVAQFNAFIQATGYTTEAERFGDSGVFSMEKQGWELLKGAFWKKPMGPNGPDAVANHPVTHVSWNDANAYAKWAGKRLPTEMEWEYAARSGKNSGEKFSWGNELEVNGKYFANTWQGEMNAPETKDGYLFTSPVGVFGENEAGLTDMGGNVWQWCADTYKAYPGSAAPIREDQNVKTIRSGSFFYDQYGEDSFSVSGRSGNSHETSLFNTGFRCAMDAN